MVDARGGGDHRFGPVADRSSTIPARVSVPGGAGDQRWNRPVRKPLTGRNRHPPAPTRHFFRSRPRQSACGASDHADDRNRGVGFDAVGFAKARGRSDRPRAGSGRHRGGDADGRQLFVGDPPGPTRVASAGADRLGGAPPGLDGARPRRRCLPADQRGTSPASGAAHFRLYELGGAAGACRGGRGRHRGPLGCGATRGSARASDRASCQSA